MARTFGGVSTDKVVTTLTSHATLRTYHVWAYRTGLGGGNIGRLFDKRTSGAQVETWYSESTDTTMAYSRLWSTESRWTIPKPGDNAWHSHALRYDAGAAANDPSWWVDGSSQTVTNAIRGATSHTDNAEAYVIGNRANDNARNWAGNLAEFAVWDRLLSDDEVIALSKGYSPLMFPNGLVEYVPMVRDNISFKLAAPAITGTVVVEHPRIILPAGVRSGVQATGTVAKAGSDTGTGTDASTVTTGGAPNFVQNDSGAGVESLSILDTGDIESGTGVDTASIVKVVSDAGVGDDASDVDTGPSAFIGSDAGVGSEHATLSIAGVATATPVEYAIELWSSGGTFGPSQRIGEVWDARNLGWSRYDRLPGKGFFTLSQASALLPLIVPLSTHVAVWRITPTAVTQVYAGQVIDSDSTGDDVVFNCFDYQALLSVSRSGYRTMYPTKKIGTEIVSPEWVLAKTTTTFSPLAFVATGTIEDPLGNDAVTAIKTNNQFGLLDQMRLALFYDLSEIGRANTPNHVTFEITRTAPYTFHFRKNKGSALNLGLVLNGNVSNYRHLPNWTGYRNDLATIGSTLGGGATEVVVTDETEAADKARRQDVFTLKTLLGIVGKATEADQQKAAAERVLKRTVGLSPTLLLRLVSGAVDPFVGWDISDKPLIEIGNGLDSIAERWRIVGTRGTFDEAGEKLSIIVAPVAV